MLYKDRKRELDVLWQGAPAPVYQQPPPQQQPAYGAPQQAAPQYGAPPQQGGPPAYGQPQQQGPPQQYGAPAYGQPGNTSDPAFAPLPDLPNFDLAMQLPHVVRGRNMFFTKAYLETRQAQISFSLCSGKIKHWSGHMSVRVSCTCELLSLGWHRC